MHRVDKRHVRAGDRRGAGAAVGLQHIAVDLHLVLAERLHIDDATQAAADQTADLMRAASDLATHRLAVRAVGGGARQHRVFRGNPAQTGILAPTRHARGEGGRAHHARVAAFDEHGAFRNVREMPGDAHRTQLVHLASVRTHHRLIAQHILDRYHFPYRTSLSDRFRCFSIDHSSYQQSRLSPATHAVPPAPPARMMEREPAPGTAGHTPADGLVKSQERLWKCWITHLHS